MTVRDDYPLLAGWANYPNVPSAVEAERALAEIETLRSEIETLRTGQFESDAD